MAVLVSIFVAAVTLAGDVVEEHAEIQERLEAEREALMLLADEKNSLIDLIDRIEKSARDATKNVRGLEATHKRVRLGIIQARKNRDEAEVRLQDLRVKVRPRIVSLNNLLRRSEVAYLLDAPDFVALWQRRRALKTIVQTDLRMLSDVERLTRYQQSQVRRLARLEHRSLQSLAVLRWAETQARSKTFILRAVLKAVSRDERRLARAVNELARQEETLSQLVAEIDPATDGSSFRSRKGFLPFPTKGLVEAAFGRVINPKFNTVTVHNGIDIRAAPGMPVISVAEGSVAYSGWLKGFGQIVIVDHGGGYHSLYAHLAESQVEAGNSVEEGESLGLVGDTGSLKGAYLYFEIRKAGEPVDPMPWLRFE